MKKLNKVDGRIDILYRNDAVEISMYDSNANILLATTTMSEHDFLTAAMGRLMRTRCEIEVGELENVGKHYETSKFSFELPACSWNERDARAAEMAKIRVPDGWSPSLYFGSQGSFRSEGDKCIVRCGMFRWTEGEADETT